MTQRLRTVSLRSRVTALSLAVLAAVLLVVGVLTDVVFSRPDPLRAARPARRARRAGRAAGRAGVPAAEVARRVEAPGIRAEVVAADGSVYAGDDDSWGPPWRGRPPGGEHGWWDDDEAGDWRDAQVLEQPLADGSRLTLVGDRRAGDAAPRSCCGARCSLLGLAALAGGRHRHAAHHARRARAAGRDDGAGPLDHPRRPRPAARTRRAPTPSWAAPPPRSTRCSTSWRAPRPPRGRPRRGRAGSSPTPRTSCAPRSPGCRPSRRRRSHPAAARGARAAAPAAAAGEPPRGPARRRPAGARPHRRRHGAAPRAGGPAGTGPGRGRARAAASHPTSRSRYDGEPVTRTRRRVPARPGAGQPARQRPPPHRPGAVTVTVSASVTAATVLVTDDGPGRAARRPGADLRPARPAGRGPRPTTAAPGWASRSRAASPGPTAATCAASDPPSGRARPSS